MGPLPYAANIAVYTINDKDLFFFILSAVYLVILFSLRNQIWPFSIKYSSLLHSLSLVLVI